MLLGGGAGVGIGWSLALLSKTHTKPWQLAQPPFGGREFIRILAIGEDNTAKRNKNGRGLSDTIMVAAVDLRNKTVRAVSIPRDTRVDIPGHGIQKINAAHVFGGPDLVRRMAEQLLGVTIDYYVRTDIDGLKNIVDSVGGVGIEIEKDMNYTDRRGGLRIHLRKGYRHLNGDQALQYVRFRHDAWGDVGYEMVDGKKVATGRIVRQQKFLRALARQMMQVQNLPKLPSLVAEMYDKGYVETDMSLVDIKALVKIARDILPEDMAMETVPGMPQNIGGVSYWIPDPEATKEVVAQMLEWNPTPSAASLSVEVLNGSGVDGIASRVAERLEAMGYKVVSTGNAPSYDYDRCAVICRGGVNTQVRELAKIFSCAEVKEASGRTNPGSPDVTVIVGKDYGEGR